MINPNVPVVFKDYRKQSLFQEVLKDEAIVFLAELLHAALQVLVLRRLRLQFLYNKFVEVVDAGAAVTLHIELAARHSIHHQLHNGLN